MYVFQGWPFGNEQPVAVFFPENGHLSLSQLYVVAIACSSLHKADGHNRERTPFLVACSWILAWSVPCEDLPTGCTQLTSHGVSMFRKDIRNDLWGLLCGSTNPVRSPVP